MMGKQHGFLFLKNKTWMANTPTELIRSDLCYMEVPTNDGCKYFITLADDFGQKVWVYFLRN